MKPFVLKDWKANQLHSPNPYRFLAVSFFFTMAIGTFLLMLPISTADGSITSFVDAAFTAVSCVSVTGLATVDTYYHWSLFGKIVMVILIQLGGLGIVTFTTLIAVVMGKKIGLQNRLVLQEDMGNSGIQGILGIMKRVFIFTMAAEFLGGLIYVVQLYPYIGPSAVYVGFMQAVSIFCNAGFVFFDNALPYEMVDDWLFTLNTTGLIIVGGFGYLALFDLWENRHKRNFIELRLNTKLMLVGTAVLISLGTILILLIEWHHLETLGSLSISGKIQAAFFQAVTPRTAGVATLDYGVFHPITLFLTIILMFIGAGPNSTGGGVKITTFIVAFLSTRTLFNNRPNVEVFERRVAPLQAFKAHGIILLSLSFIVLATCFLAWNESIDFIRLLFEVTSAFGTVGLSTGITPELSDSSKWVLMLVMFTGRVGVMTMVGTWALRTTPTKPIAYPEGNILM